MIVCLGAGVDQVPVIETAQRLGYGVVAIDSDETLPGVGIADEFIHESIWRGHDVCRALWCYNVEAVLNRASGPAMLTAALISTLFDLPGINPDHALRLTHKNWLAVVCRGLGIKYPRGTTKPPAVIKPAFGLGGKKGVSIVHEMSGWVEAVELAREHTIPSGSGDLRTEEYIPGRDISLIAVVSDGALHPLTLLDEYKEGNTWKVRRSDFIGTTLETRAIEIASRIMLEHGIKRSPLNLNLRHHHGRLTLIEIHLELPGGEVTTLNPDLLETAVGLLL